MAESKPLLQPEFVLERDGSVSRASLLTQARTLEVHGTKGDAYWVRVEHVARASGAVKGSWCVGDALSKRFALPELPGLDHYRVHVFGKYDANRDAEFLEATRERELEPRERVEEWKRHAFAALTAVYAPNQILLEDGALTRAGVSLNYQISSAFKAGRPCGASQKDVEQQGLCSALLELQTKVLNSAEVSTRRTEYDELVAASEKPAGKATFCESAYRAHFLEHAERGSFLLLSSNELPAASAGSVHEVRLGSPKLVTSNAPVGTPAVTWVTGVPAGVKPEVTWKAEAAVKSQSLEPIAAFLEIVLKAALNVRVDAHGAIDSPSEERQFSDLLDSMRLGPSCGASPAKIPFVAIAPRVSRVHVGEPLLGYKAYTLSVCAREGGCEDPKTKEAERGLVEVHTRAEGWRVTLAAGVGANVPGGQPFESWKWRPVGSSTGAERLYQYSREVDPLAYSSTSLLLTFLSPTYWGPGQIGFSAGPNLLLGAEFRPLRQWSANFVWALPQGIQLQLGPAVRIIDTPRETSREGELQLVARGTEATLPDLDQRQTVLPTIHAAVAIDLGFLGDSGAALLKALGVK